MDKKSFTREVKGTSGQSLSPLDLDGMYVVEVTAYDNAGNIAFCTKMLLIVDPATLCVQLMPYDYIVEIIQNEYVVDVVHPLHGGRCCCGER